MVLWPVAVALQCAAGPPASREDFLADLAVSVRAKLDALIAARAPTPPTPVTVSWKVAKLPSEIPLDAPVVAIAAAELDGDRTAGELYVVTSREVVALGFAQGRLIVRGRVAFDRERAVSEPRDVVGTAVVAGNELVASASPWQKELRIAWRAGELVGRAVAGRFLVCPGERAELVPGRNYFLGDLYAVRCRRDLVDHDGHPLEVRAELAITHQLRISVKRCVRGAGRCEEAGQFSHQDVGTAVEIADIDRDGTPELIVAQASAPGAPDSVTVRSLGSTDMKPRFQRRWNGGVAGIVVVDGDDPDDLPEVLVAVRLPGSNRVDIWRLN